MDLRHAFSRAVVFLVVLLKTSLASGKQCTEGFLSSLSIRNYNRDRVMPLLGQYRGDGVEQWIFPSLQFTCSGNVTKWRFRVPSTSAQIPSSSQRRINIGTWRQDTTSSTILYRRQSTTASLRYRITYNNQIITYELASPVQVEPGDIVGIEQQAGSAFSSSCNFYSGDFGNILSLVKDLSSTDTISQSYRHSVVQSNFRATYLVPFIQPVIETATVTATVEEPTIGNPIFIAPLTSSQADEEISITSSSDPFSTTTTEGGSDRNGPTLSTTTEVDSNSRSGPLSTTTDSEVGSDTANDYKRRHKIIVLATGVGLGTIVLLSMAIACISIMKCIQARSANQRKCNNIEEPQTDSAISSSSGILLHENTAYRKMMNKWSETLSTEGGKISDIKQLQQNTFNSDHNLEVVGHETSTFTQEKSEPCSAQPQHINCNDSSMIVVQENTAYKKSTNSRDNTVTVVASKTTSTVQERNRDVNQCANSSGSGIIVVHKNTAYKKSTNKGDTAVAGYETMDEMDKQVVMQLKLNQAYGLQGESQGGRESVYSGNYEMLTCESAHDHGGRARGGVDQHSTLAKPVVYHDDMLSRQQQRTNREDNEHSYDYVI